MKKMIFTLVLAIVSSVWMTNEASNWCMPAAQTSTEQPIRIGGTFQTDIFPCVDETEPCPPCLTIVLASGGHYYLVSDDPQVLATLDTVTIGSFAIIEGIHYLEGHYDFIHVTHIFFPETDITQLTGEWEVYKETVSTPTGDAGTRWFSTHDVNNTNYIIENNSIYKVVLDQASGYAHYSDIVPYSIDKKENGTWLLTAEGMFSSSDPVGEGIPTPVTIYKLTENEIEWMYAANGGDEGPSFYYQYLRRNTYERNDKLPSLCDEWNVLEISNVTCGYCEEYRTYNFHLTTDTVIGGLLYSQLIKDGAYKGALREGNNRDIYCVPAGCSQEYLLYAFNAQVGDSLKNIWVGGNSSWIPDVRSAIVSEIKQTTPRTIELEVHYYEAPDAYEESIRNLTWIEGIGMPFGPMGAECSVFNGCGDSKAKLLLCAYKNGEQVYVSDMGEQYGCVYNDDENQHLSMFPSDTRWHYVLNILTGEPEPIIKYYSIEPIDTLINNTRYQKIQNALFRSSGAKVWCALDSVGTLVERLVYDFDLQVGDSISITVGNENGIWLVPEEDPTYAKVTNVEYIKLADGRMARRISYDYRSDDIEHIGSVKGILAPLSYPGHPDSWSLLLCCTRSDFLLYEAENGACDTFLVNVQHTDTIPLYARDDSGSSTVDPVDPNQIYATLTGDKLTVHNNTGSQVTFTLNNTSVNNIAARVRANTEPVSFTESISVELSENGIYEILLTSEEWNYSVFGTINYVRYGTEITKEETSSTSKKVLRGTQILIEREGKTYTLTGQEVK